MNLGLSLSLTQTRRAISGGAAASVDALFSSVAADGWQATYGSALSTEFDPAGDPETFTVTRSGFNTSGSATTYNDTLTVMKRVREPYPDEDTLTSDKASLSEFIYSGDVISGATNNSTRAAPKPIAYWITPQRQVISADTFTPKLVVAHAHARNGKPVAAVKFSLTDGTTTVEQTVSTLTTASWSASGLSAPCYEATLSTTGLTDGATLTLDVTIYPWVGAAMSASDFTSASGINFSEQTHVLNRAGGYGIVYAYVDGTGGGTPAVSETPATAATTPYETIGDALAAIQTYNNSNFSRNNASGGIVRLTATTHDDLNFASVAVGDAYPIVEAADAADKATTIVTHPTGASATGDLCDLLLIRNCTVTHEGGSRILFDGNAGADAINSLLFENCAVNLAATTYGAAIYRTGATIFLNCTGTGDVHGAAFSTTAKMAAFIGSAIDVDWSSTYHVIGCNSPEIISKVPSLAPETASNDPRVGTFAGWSFMKNNNAADGQVIDWNIPIGERGMAIIGNIMEAYGSQSGSAMFLNADGDTNPVQNVVVMGNTAIGERWNFLYNDTGTSAVAKSATMKFNSVQNWNSKADVFPTASGNRTGNWPVIFKVGIAYNAIQEGSAAGDTPGPGEWIGEVAGLGEVIGSGVSPLSMGYENDKSNDGDGVGGGDYSITGTTDIPQIPAALLPYPTDLYGNTTPTDGTAYAGAVNA